MSQSDYLKYKRVATQLKIDTLSPVISNQEYTDFKQHTIESIITNNTTLQNVLQPPNTNIIFDMQMNVSNCPQFPVCKDTNTRTNREPLLGIYFMPRIMQKYVKPIQYKPVKKCQCII
jgi:hypothetical protein